MRPIPFPFAFSPLFSDSSSRSSPFPESSFLNFFPPPPFFSRGPLLSLTFFFLLSFSRFHFPFFGGWFLTPVPCFLLESPERLSLFLVLFSRRRGFVKSSLFFQHFPVADFFSFPGTCHCGFLKTPTLIPLLLCFFLLTFPYSFF